MAAMGPTTSTANTVDFKINIHSCDLQGFITFALPIDVMETLHHDQGYHICRSNMTPVGGGMTDGRVQKQVMITGWRVIITING